MFFRHLIALIAAFSALLALAHPARAADYLTGSVGYYDAIRGDYDATEFGLEYRFSPLQYHLRPVIGGYITTDTSAYGYAGINFDVPILSNQLYLIPSFAVGAYSKGDGKDLGGTLEFRSGIELDYQMEDRTRIGVALTHLSNASIYSRNPGVETVLVNYSIPTGSLFGK